MDMKTRLFVVLSGFGAVKRAFNHYYSAMRVCVCCNNWDESQSSPNVWSSIYSSINSSKCLQRLEVLF